MTPPDAHRLQTDTDDGMLLVISGPSGVGKTTITRAVERSIPGSVFSVSATTRPRTGVDVEGVDYQFVTVEDFKKKVDNDEFLEHAIYAGNHYGTLRAPVETHLARGRLVILEIDVQGAIQVKRRIPDCFAIFILPPSEEELLRRLEARKREDQAAIRRRFDLARAEIEKARTSGAYNAFIINDNLARAIGEALALVTSERMKKRMKRRIVSDYNR